MSTRRSSASSTERFRTRTRATMSDDAGSTLALVMVVTTLCMIFVTTSVALSTSNIAPSQQTADSMAALAAAQAGVEQLSVAVEACPSNVTSCVNAAGAVRNLVGTDGLVRSTARWVVDEEPLQNTANVLRVAVTGQVRAEQRTLVVDLQTTPSPLSYAYVTELETLSAQTISTYYGPRTVALTTSTFRSKANLVPSTTTSVKWQGAQGTDICGVPWYDTTKYGAGRSSLRTTRALGVGFDYYEQFTPVPAAPARTRKAPCEAAYGTDFQTAFGTSSLYSKDALYLSRTFAGGSGPYFGSPVVTEWGPGAVPEPMTPGAWYRSDAVLGGAPAPGGVVPSLSTGPLELPGPVTNRDSTSTCVFTGPTRINVNGTNAYITSPGTLTPPCAGTVDTTLSGVGLVNFRVPITASTVLYVKDGVAGANATADAPLFNARTISTAGNVPQFYAEMSTTEATLKSTIVAGPYTAALETTLTPWLNALNAAQPRISGAATYQALPLTAVGLPGSLNPGDALYDLDRATAKVQRRTCTLYVIGICFGFTPWTDAFFVTSDSRTFPIANDITPYQNGSGTAFVDGSMAGRLTVAAQDDVVVTGVIEQYGSGGIVGLVAGNGRSPGADVEIYHPVRCALLTPVTLPGGTCPNDLTSLSSAPIPYADVTHPSRQYVNLKPAVAYVKAVILSHDGCLCVQNFMRGAPFGSDLVIKGAVYQRHHGSVGVQYGSQTERSGYTKLYLDYDPGAKTPPTRFGVIGAADGATLWQLLGVAERQG